MDLPNSIMLQVARDFSPDQVAEQLGIPVVDVLRQIDRDADTRLNSQTEYTPTPDEIRSACLAIQSEWNEQEQQRRVAVNNPPAAIPQDVRLEL